MSDIYIIIIASAMLNYMTRLGGHLALSRFGTLNPRVEAALNAVPAAVITTLVAPTFFTHAWPETVALLVAGLAALRLPLLGMFAVGWVAIVGLRWIAGM
jgi:uncharacterized membrane protein